jgi:hypothetical protein
MKNKYSISRYLEFTLMYLDNTTKKPENFWVQSSYFFIKPCCIKIPTFEGKVSIPNHIYGQFF